MKMPVFEDLSREQEMLYLKAPLDGAVLVTGPPGTGKTVMGFYRAESVIKKGKAVKVLMYNNVLKKYSAGSFPNKAVAQGVSTWHSWFAGWWQSMFGQKPPTEAGSNFDHDWDDIFLKLMRQAPKGFNSFGHLVLDEGQDFPKKFYDSLNLVLNSNANATTSCATTVFADDNQRIRDRNSTIAQIRAALAIVNGREYKLTKNYRNSLQIAKLASSFYVGLQTGMPNLPEGKNGPTPVMLRSGNDGAVMDYIANFSRNNDDLTIGVFADSQTSQKSIYNKLKHRLDNSKVTVQRFTSGGGSYYGDADNLDFRSSGTVTVLCMQSCKGLEFDVVFIPELQNFRFDPAMIDVFKMQMYVLVSRARTQLYLTCSLPNNVRHPVLDLLPSHNEGILEYKSL